MRVGSLFAGIGGFDLAARWMGWETAWFSEIDPYASAVLEKHWPGVPNHGDITRIDFTQVEPVDMLCGGFPCQDISNAGKRKGIEGERSGLWSEYARAIGELRPRYVVVENVAALLGRGLERVLGDLAALGYDAEWEVLRASWFGVPQDRDRIFIVAHPPRHRSRTVFHQDTFNALRYSARLDGRSGKTPDAYDENYRAGAVPVLGYSEGAALPNGSRSGTYDGVPRRMDRYRAIGNAIVPQVALEIFRAIEAADAVSAVA